jgi:hypothetical protein
VDINEDLLILTLPGELETIKTHYLLWFGFMKVRLPRLEKYFLDADRDGEPQHRIYQ